MWLLALSPLLFLLGIPNLTRPDGRIVDAGRSSTPPVKERASASVTANATGWAALKGRWPSATAAAATTTTVVTRALPVATTTEPAQATTTIAIRPAPMTTTTAAPASTTAKPVVNTTTSPPRPVVTVPSSPAVASAKPATASDHGTATWFSAPDGTCAHVTLPKGTIVTVTRVSTGVSTTCKVNDRGVFAEGVIIDLSKDTFVALAPLATGVIAVRISW